MDFHVTEYDIYRYMVSNPTSQLAFKKLSFVKFWCNIKEEYPQFSEKAINISLLSPTTYLSEVGFSSYTSIKTLSQQIVQKQI